MFDVFTEQRSIPGYNFDIQKIFDHYPLKDTERFSSLNLLVRIKKHII